MRATRRSLTNAKVERIPASGIRRFFDLVSGTEGVISLGVGEPDFVTPTSPTVAFPIGAKVNDPLSMYLNDIFTLPVNISGLPGISVPCGLSEGLPVGLQVIAKSYQERTMFRVAAAYERATSHHLERPKEKAA